MAASEETDEIPALRFGVREDAVFKWYERDSMYDASHTLQQLQTTLRLARQNAWSRSENYGLCPGMSRFVREIKLLVLKKIGLFAGG